MVSTRLTERDDKALTTPAPAKRQPPEGICLHAQTVYLSSVTSLQDGSQDR